jgi:hypothetical protein
MSESNPTPDPAPTPPASPATPAQEAFGKYKARLAGGPMAFPAMTGWGMPPSMGALPGYPMPAQGPSGPHPLGSLTERLGATVRLGLDLLNATLASGANALGGGMMPSPSGPWGGHGHGCGCDSCGYNCCEVFDSGCCRPGVHGCGCGCC